MSRWHDKWKSIQSKLSTLEAECITAHRSDQRCKDSIEAVLSDIWHLKEWLKNDPATGLNDQDINQFLDDETRSWNISACGDLETANKHLRVDDPRRKDTTLKLEKRTSERDGLPIIYSATRDHGGGNLDTWEDATELARRAIREWRAFLGQHSLPIPEPGAGPPRHPSKLSDWAKRARQRLTAL